MATPAQINAITALYAGYFDRAPDPAGLQFWINEIDNGRAFNTIAADFAASPEATALYPFLTTPGVSSPASFITTIYTNLFNRAPDALGLTYWTDVLSSKTVSVADMIEAIINGARDDATATPPTFDKATLDNKVAAGFDFAQKAALIPGFTFDATAKAAAIEVLNGVTNDPATVTAAAVEATAALAGTGLAAGQTFALTTGIDTLVGTAGGDTFTGTLTNDAETTTLTVADAIDGGAGIDTLRIVATDDAFDADAVVTLNNIERVEIRDLDGIRLNATDWNGVATIVKKGGDSATRLDNVGAIAAVEMTNEDGNLDLNYTAVATNGTTDVQKVAINGANANVDASGVEAFEATIEGAFEGTETNTSNFISNGAGFKSVTLSGSGNLVTTLDSEITTANASAMTGNLTATVTGTTKLTATGGTGDDSFFFGGSLTDADTVDGGAGFDTVRVDGGNNYAAATNVTLKGLNALTNVERVEFQQFAALGTTINGSTFTNAAVTHFLFDTFGIDTVNNADSTREYQFGENNGGSAIFNMKGGSTSLNVELAGTNGLDAVLNDGTDADLLNLTVALSGTEAAGTKATINLTSSGDLPTGAVNNVNQITAVSGSTFNIDGAADLDIALFANNVVVDASAFTGDLEIQGSAKAVGDVGSVDAATSGQGVDKITLGAGQDTVVFNNNGLDSGIIEFTGTTTAGTANGNILVDTLISFTAGADGDVMKANATTTYTALAAAAQAQIDALSGVTATMVAAADLAAAANTSAGWTAYDFQGQTYALYENTADVNVFENNDILVQLTGVSVADLTQDNFA